MRHGAAPVPRTAESRTRRVLGVALGVAALFYAINGYGVAYAQLEVMHPAAVPLYLAGSLVPIALGLASPWAPDWVIRMVGTIHCLVYAVSLATFVPLLTVPHLPGSTTPWTYDVTVVATAAAALCWPRRAAWLYAVTISVGAGVLRSATLPGEAIDRGFQDGALILAAAVIFVALPQLALNAARGLDLAGARAREEATNDARVRAVRNERIRLNALMHDHVLALLLAAGRSSSDPAERAELQASAKRVLEILPARDSIPLETHMSAAEFLDRLGEIITSGFERRESGLPPEELTEVMLPQAAANALIGAAAEAMTNSERHAGPAERIIEVRIGALGRVEIVIADNGRGFSRAGVPPERLGVQLSMEARTSSVGGRAEIVSRPGEGTTVRLVWPVLDETGRAAGSEANEPTVVSS